MKYKIYILRLNGSNIVKYVGLTSGTLKNRLNKHTGGLIFRYKKETNE